MTIPSRLRSALGVADGDLMEASVQRGKIILTPKEPRSGSGFAHRGDKYTAAQRRVIDRGIAQSEKEYGQGRSFGPFETHEEFVTSLHHRAKKVPNKKSKRVAQ